MSVLTSTLIAVSLLSPTSSMKPYTSITDFGGVDGTFGSGWTWTGVVNDSRCTLYYSPFSSGGNPTDFRRDKVSFAVGKSYFARGQIFALDSNKTWTPTTSPTAFHHLNIAWDLRHPEAPPLDARQQPLIYQDGKYYMGPPAYRSSTSGDTWEAWALTDIVATDFYEVDYDNLDLDLNSHPDFETGGTMTFGYTMRAERLGLVWSFGDCDIDNWNIELFRN